MASDIGAQLMRILLVEDNRDIAASIADYLEIKGHSCDYASDGPGGLHMAMSGNYDVLVLDVMLPGMDGLSICERVRSHSSNDVPVIFLTARDRIEDKIAGFKTGADDYLVKPFELAELLIRLEALGRRGRMTTETRYEVADLSVDRATGMIKRSDQLIELSPTCRKLLLKLCEESPNIVDRETLEYTLWGDSPPDSDSLRSNLYTLRQAIDRDFTPALIHTIRGVGYRLAVIDENT